MSWYCKAMVLRRLPQILFHATYNAYLDQIMREGLRPGVHKNWEWSCPDAVHLAVIPDVAYGFADNAMTSDWKDKKTGIVILSVNTNMLDRERFDIDQNIGGNGKGAGYLYRGTIPPLAIKVVEGDLRGSWDRGLEAWDSELSND